jgi:trans-aconitate 2-methyltransferase
MASPWNPDQYARFRNERSQPFFDMLELVQPAPGGRAVDLGCGTGELTPALHFRLQARESVGIDNSESMLAKSGEFAGDGVRFERGEIGAFAPAEPFDVVFSNAALQWVDRHEELFPRLASAVAPGGQLAVQMPANDDHPSHLTAHAVASEEPFATALGGYSRSWPVKKPEWYAELLDRLGFSEQSVRLQVYGHHLASREEVVEWVKGTLLTDYQKRMPAESYERYLQRYRERLMAQLEDRRPYFYAFKRVLVWGRK